MFDTNEVNQMLQDFQYELESPILLQPGKYLFAIDKTDPKTYLSIGADIDNQSTKNWVITEAFGAPNWTPTHLLGSSSSVVPNYMIRPNFAPDILDNVSQIENDKINELINRREKFAPDEQIFKFRQSIRGNNLY